MNDHVHPTMRGIVNAIAIPKETAVSFPELKQGMRIRPESGRRELIVTRNTGMLAESVDMQTGVTMTFEVRGDFVHEYSADQGATWQRYEDAKPVIEVPKELFVNVYDGQQDVYAYRTAAEAKSRRIGNGDGGITKRYIPELPWTKCVAGTIATERGVALWGEPLTASSVVGGFEFGAGEKWYLSATHLIATLPK
jgi:hypothetical protein